jgi:tyrosyl-tRNA synthetase
MIGDPSGRSDERSLLTDDVLSANLEGIVPQLRRCLDFDPGPTQARLHDNRSWTLSMSALEFLRDVGKHVTVNQMLAKDSVRSRLRGESGISYTEFSYMLLQANDFYELHRLEGCELQVGGSDQWGNIVAGVDLIRRRSSAAVHALTCPLLLKADGTKYGKTAGGETMWLGAARMSPYRFYQAWMQIDDGDVRRLLLQLTLLSPEEAGAVADEHDQAPHRRAGQRRIAAEVTALIHGEAAARDAAAASEVLFGSDPSSADAATFAVLAGEIPTVTVGRAELAAGVDAAELLQRCGLVASKAEARRTIEQGGVAVNGSRLEVGSAVGSDRLLHERYLLFRKGKNRYALVTTG